MRPTPSITPSMTASIRTAGLIVALAFFASCVPKDSLERWGLGGEEKPLDEATVAAGLKEALRIGTERTVDVTSRVDGFWGNALIRIIIPEQFQGLAKSIRSVGLGRQVDEFERAMNRSAELAAKEATSVFWNAISAMTIADAFNILTGGETAATDYFRDRTYERLYDRFQPIVQTKMSEAGLYRIYNNLMDHYDALPITSKPTFDMDAYITEKSLDGLFTILAQEEKRIREDPLARTTDLLRRVFR